MKSFSVNGKLIATIPANIKDEYLGHFLKVNYIQSISGQNVFSKDRVDVDPVGNFRFHLPKKDLIVNQMITIEVFAPDGEMLGKQIYSYDALKAKEVPINAEDTSHRLKIDVNPKIIKFNEEAPSEQLSKKISGKVIDLSGEGRAGGLQVLIMTSTKANAEFKMEDFKTIFSSKTDKNGYFFGAVKNNKVKTAFGVIAGHEKNPVVIPLDDEKLPKNIILVTDLSGLPDDLGCACGDSVPGLPDSSDLVNSSSFSQDLGGTCVDFTIPNRTLEEFSFYHTVRTTEPEIKGLTITSKKTKNIKNKFFDISRSIFDIVGRLNNSFNSLALIPYSIEEEDDDVAASIQPNDDVVRVETLAHARKKGIKAATRFPNYLLKMDTGGSRQFKINTNDLVAAHRRLKPVDILKIAQEQQQRKKKLINLHQKLAAAYCGKNGVEDAKTYCESLSSKDGLNRPEIESLLANVDRTRRKVNLDAATKKKFSLLLIDMEKLLLTDKVDVKILKAFGKKVETLAVDIDSKITESSTGDSLVRYLKRIALLFDHAASNPVVNFEPCPPKSKPENMGILCLIEKFNELKETLRNTKIFSLAQILEIRSYYNIFVNSINSFLNLLDEFYTFYNSSLNFATELPDDYFYQNYTQIKSSLTSLKRQIYLAIRTIEEIERAYILNHPGRANLSVENSIDWDETPTIYENTTIANGHILHFKQKWKADGYSLGDLLYSLPLAPCQEKQIAIVDWDRDERASRLESQVAADQLEAEISRDRDITEIMNSSFGESIRASSTNKTKSTSAGIGGGIGGFLGKAVFGIAGGVAHSGASSSSTANQNSSRNLAASSLNRLQDNTTQSASSLRSQRSTVIQTVGQNESVSVQTEVIKNNNHCHAMTVEYFEVLKHYALEQELVDVQECLFVPMPMSLFDNQKVMRWSNTLRRAMYGRKLLRGFDAIERIESNYVNSDLPTGTYADEMIQEFTCHFTMSFELERPFIKEIDEATKTEEYDLSIPFPWFFGRMVFHLEREVPLTEAEKDAIFERDYAPDIVRAFIDTLSFYAIADDGTEQELDLDVTLLSNYRKGSPLRVSINMASVQNITRREIKYVRFRANTNVKPTSKIILRSAFLNYKTNHMSGYIMRKNRINNDIINSLEFDFGSGLQTVTDAALIYTPLHSRELRNPRKEDQEAATALVSFLNEYLETSHKIIWSSMDASRLFGLLDGYLAPNSGGKSVASVVENKVMGIVGNNLVLKVIPGERLDPVFKGVENLLEYYQPTTKPDPYRISVPTKGVYAESVMGKCNSCEEIDETRHWRFSDEPCGSSPTAIEPVSAASRRSDPGNLQAKDLPASIINMQTAPTAPDPTGLAAAYGLLGQGDSFRDMTGLAGTQANALGALQTTSKSVTDLASISKDFAGLAVMANQKEDGAKQIEQIKKLNKQGYLSDDEAKGQIKNVLDSYTDAAKNLTNNNKGGAKTAEVNELAETAGKNKAAINVKRPSGEQIEVDARPVPTPASNTGTSLFERIFGDDDTPQAGASGAPNLKIDKPRAITKIQAFKAQSTSGAWHSSLKRDDVADGLTRLVNTPDSIDQETYGFCGPAAFFNIWFRRDPLATSIFAIKLYNNGSSYIGSKKVEPGRWLHGDDIRQSNYSDIEKAVSAKGHNMLPPAEWMIMGAYQDTINTWFEGDFEGSPDETDVLGVSQAETTTWLKATNLFTSVTNDTTKATKTVDHLTALVPTVNREILLLITAHLINAGNKKTPTANHYVILRSKVEKDPNADKYTFDVWTWGGITNVVATKAEIESMYFGAIVCER